MNCAFVSVGKQSIMQEFLECVLKVWSLKLLGSVQTTRQPVYGVITISLWVTKVVSTQTHQTMLDMIVVLCNDQLGVAVSSN